MCHLNIIAWKSQKNVWPHPDACQTHPSRPSRVPEAHRNPPQVALWPAQPLRQRPPPGQPSRLVAEMGMPDGTEMES